jgi:hypothetical protein
MHTWCLYLAIVEVLSSTLSLMSWTQYKAINYCLMPLLSTIQMCMKSIKENVAFKMEVKMANQQDFDNLNKKQIANIHEEIILGC